MSIRRKAIWIASAVFASTFAFGSSFAACNNTCPDTGDGKTCADHSAAVARIDDQDITHAELEKRAAVQLQQLDMQRNQLLESTLAQIIDEQLLAMEAKRRGMSSEELIHAEVVSKVEVDDAEVGAWYETNQARIRKPKEAVAGQIRELLIGQKSQSFQQALIAGLRAKHEVQTLLQPFRASFTESTGQAGPTKGEQQAPVELVIFSDFQCPYCRNIAPILDQVLETYGEKVRLEFRQFPLTSIHPEAMQAAEVASCAQAQGKFWSFHDSVFENFGQLATDQLLDRAQEVGLDPDELNRCLDSGEGRKVVDQDLSLGRSAGVSGTPAIFVNGRPVPLTGRVSPFEQISVLVDDEVGRLAP